MRIRAQIDHHDSVQHVEVATGEVSKTVHVPARESGQGSSINGGEALCFALATCYCNDIYREAAHMGIDVAGVQVTVEADFGGPGEPATNVHYRVKATSTAPRERVEKLIEHTDRVAEVHATLRAPTQVTLDGAAVVGP